MLLGRKVAVRSGTRMHTGGRDIYTAATFKSEDGALIGMCAIDIPLSSALGCALSLIPPHIHKKIVQTGTFDEMSWENLHEIYNIATRFYHDAFCGQMISLDKVATNPGDLSREHLLYIRSAAARHDFGADVHGYGSGAICFASNWGS
jgi:hypothetical protein